jgi:tetratricopeptide (TPR) repeat protein
MSAEYVKIVENEWLAATAKTEELKKDLDRTLSELSGQNGEREKLRAETATMHYNLAVILTDQQNYPAAIREYEKVLETRPNDADAHYNLAILYDDAMKNNEKAIEHYRQYIRIAPDAPEAQRVRQWMKDKEFDNTFKFKI